MTVTRILTVVPFDVTKEVQDVELAPDAEVYAVATGDFLPSTSVLLVGNPEGASAGVKRRLWVVRPGQKISREAQDGIRLAGQYAERPDLNVSVLFIEKEQDAIMRSRHRGFNR